MQANQPCYCGSNQPFRQCCEQFLNYNELPVTAEQLMRSRYSAFVTENEAYLLHSWQKNHRPSDITFDPNTKWLGLKIKKTKFGNPFDTVGWVEFIARYKVAGKAERIKELSYFVKEGDQWLYVSAETKPWEALS